MIELRTIRKLSFQVLFVLFLSPSLNAQGTSNIDNTADTGNASRIIAGCVVLIVFISALLCFRRMRRKRGLIGVTIPRGQSRRGGSTPAPFNGFRSPGPSYNPPVGGYNESYSYPPNYAPPAYGKDAPPGSQPYPPHFVPPSTNQDSYTSVKAPNPPAPAHVTDKDGTAGPWN